ncbi:MAG: glycosyltransferase [Porticoccaceae bacterium]
MVKVSCLICAYNEAPRIGGVLAALRDHPLVDEIIVIDDGSNDGTATLAQSYEGVTVLISEKNNGKSAALARGILAAQNDVLLLLDADLLGIEAGDITALLEPVLEKRADVSISLRKNSLLISRLIGLDYISGERVVPRSLLLGCAGEIARLPGFALEVYMNRLIIQEQCRLAVVWWDKVVSPVKARKFGVIQGIVGDAKMIGDILHVMSLPALVRQNREMLSLMLAERLAR